MIQILYIKPIKDGLEYAYIDYTKTSAKKYVKFIKNNN